MSIHPSLSISESDKKQRSVLKRSERIRMLVEKDKWKEGNSVFGLPKVKTLKLKIKKDKVEKADATAAGAAGATDAAAKPAAGAKPAAAAAKPAAGAKPAAKGAEKK